ncbi:MAG: hypothetical protein JO110_25960 [Acetobacteraceae bacterium]|nr:hypothetical protein [Acetobacteraceae bacterium]
MRLQILTSARPTQDAGIAAAVEPTAICSRSRLRTELLEMCEAMAEHAIANGCELSPELLARLDACLSVAAPPALRSIQPVGADTGDARVPVSPLSEAVAVYQSLKNLVAPATPGAILLFARERRRRPFLSSLGPVPLVRHFLLIAGVSLLIMLGMDLLPEINSENMRKTGMELSGWPQLIVELFLVSAASLGSCFANLQRLTNYTSTLTYDPKYQSSYWSRWVMGIISGYILSQLLFDWLADKLAGVGSGPASGNLMANLGQPALALFGGYAAGLVNRMLDRVMAAADTMFGTERRPASPS